jgi:hypothetical protein
VYRRPKFLEVLLNIREEMAREADYDIDLFVQMVQKGNRVNKVMITQPNDHKAPGSKPRKRKR